MSNIEILKRPDPEAIERWNRLHDKKNTYQCQRCGAEWRCEYKDNKFGSLIYVSRENILCQFCGEATVIEISKSEFEK